ncbi:MAG: ABC transporter permease [Acidobacteria bacterium]|nr:ABC transporter permease [Acidobacteriota bacterium]
MATPSKTAVAEGGSTHPRPQTISFWVTAREALWIALDALRAHKLRSFLTLLGVVIATTTLISVMSIVNGMNLYISDLVAGLGANVFVIHQFKWAQGYESWLKARRRNQPIRLEEYEFLKENLTGAKNLGASIGPRGRSVNARYEGRTLYEVSLEGNTPSMIDIGTEKVALGRYFTQSDYEHNAMVCFIGTDLVDEFFPNVDPIGKEITVANTPFKVIGVAEKVGTTFGQSLDKFVHIPLSTFQKVFVARPQLAVSVQAWNAEQMTVLEDQARALLRARRHIPYTEDDTFGINASDTLMETWHRLTDTIFAVAIGIVAVFMVVGGIVIMNIMLASVTERTHEIGIRKSLGARRRDVLWQFMIESSVMAGTGGALGVIASLVISRLVNIVFTSSVPVSAVVIGLLLSTAVGLFFGIYPASQAALLDPIEALRTEK